MHWKIERDPYLSALCARGGEEAAYEAGFFVDGDPTDAPLNDVDWWCTPRPKRPAAAERPAVLVTTGGFCPIHDGHLAMMEQARQAAEQAGFQIAGGYFSPGHDQYLRMKCGAAALPAYERLRLCAEAVAGSDWLSVDPWEAQHRRVSVNYTDVVARLRTYLRAHVDPRLEVLYVCGGDNARFALAFTERGGCVVVARPGSDAVAEYRMWRDRLGGHPRILWAASDSRASSRALRAEVWTAPPRARVVVRTEDQRAARTLGLPVAAVVEFQSALLRLLAAHVDVRSVPLQGDDDPNAAVISLDPMLPARHNLAISRLFALGGYERLGHVARPGAPPIEHQLAAIPGGSYTLRDDDAMTGSTRAAVRDLLPARIAIAELRVAVPHGHDEDVVDARDFLLGADEGGLVVQLPNGDLGRSPYLLPYVDPAARASVRASHAFSLDVWSLNARLFATTDLRVADLPEPARRLFDSAGNRRLDEVCNFHVERLQAIAPR